MNDNLQSGFRIGDWEVYPQENLLKGPDQECVLEPKVMDVLVFLACRQGEVVSREQLLDAVWANVVVGDENVSRAIYVLRSELGDDQKFPHYQKTISKRGYRLIADVIPMASGGSHEADPDAASLAGVNRPSTLFSELKRRNVVRVAIAYGIVAWLLIEVTATTFPVLTLPDWTATLVTVLLLVGFPVALLFAWAFELTPEGLKKEKDVDRSESITHVTGRKLDFIIITVLVLALGYFAYDKFLLQPASDSQQMVEKSIAVLPFVNISSDKEQEYFSDGITEEILNSLASVKGLKVTGRTSSFAFKEQNQDLRRIGGILGVEHILEGSVRRSGTTVRIAAQLVQVEDGFHLWSETFDRELDDIFTIQDEIAAAVVEQLKITLLSEAPTSRQTDQEVYELVLQARFFANRRRQGDDAIALDYYERAIAIDPGYAPAWAGASGLYPRLALDG
ncbi:MAG: winged helix-turn-helix domain-containing protein, partial [Woeseia sp.]